jgi:Acetyl xylan esterase (AXE1)
MRFVRRWLVCSVVLSAVALVLSPTPRFHAQAQDAKAAAQRYRTLDDRYVVRRFATLDEWRPRAAWLREHILATAGLLPMPERTPLNAVVVGERKHADYSVSKVYFESVPGFYVTGNLYKPIGTGPFPAIVSPHGHWYYGRLENSALSSIPGRSINFARQGFVVFTYDMIGYNDSRWHPHNKNHTYHERDFGGKRESLWGLSLAGMQLWNSIRSVDFLQSLPEVARDRIGATGASGGGTQTFLLAAVDDRVAVAAPVNMISLHMQGGCLCENMPGLRLDTNNVELTAVMAPRPLLMVSATGDWTKETMELEYPEMRRFYALFKAEDRVHAVRFEAEHNYNKDSREAVYVWMARWLKGAPADVKVAEREFRADPLPELMVFHGRNPPDGAITTDQLTTNWIAAARRQLDGADQQPFRAGMLHALNFERQVAPATKRSAKPTVWLATQNGELEPALARAGYAVKRVPFSAFDPGAAAKISHFDTYNRTPAGQRVADLVAALGDDPGAVLVADGDAALAGLLAAAIAPVGQAILDVGEFDSSSDAAFLEQLYIPGVRRAGDFRTAAAMARGRIVVHNAGSRFQVQGLTAQRQKLTAGEIVQLLRKRSTSSQ